VPSGSALYHSDIFGSNDAQCGDRKRRVGFGKRTALVIVDMYRGVFGDKPGVEGWSVKRGMPKSRLSDDPVERDRQLRRGDIVDQLAPIEGGAVIRKVAPSAFWGTPLAAHAMNLFDMHQKYADVLPLSDVVAHLRSLRPTSAVTVPASERLLVEAAT
jgi:hypothetical protein